MTKTIFQSYNHCKKELEAVGIEDVVFEAKQIIRHVTGYSNAQILTHYNDSLTEFQQNNLTAILKQRLARYPLQYIFGVWNFYGREYRVGPGVLVPRADTETLIDVCLDFLKDKQNPQILDLCTGSGCIGITLAKECADSTVTMVEKFSETVRYARSNIESNKAENAQLVEDDIFSWKAKKQQYHLIVSNPPYISAQEMDTVSPEVKYEPEAALYGGEDGYLFFRAIIERYTDCLIPGGMMAFECGIGQAEKLCALMQSAGFIDIGRQKDLNGIDRVVYGTVSQDNILK